MTYDEFLQVLDALRMAERYFDCNASALPDGLADEVESARTVMEMELEARECRSMPRCMDDLCDELYEAHRDAA